MKKEFTIALAGNPNVGKSTIFNALTGMRQKTGNWAGKTVACASGVFRFRDLKCQVVDLPGTYSLSTHSEEEEIAREYIISGKADLLLVVCDATCPERGLRLLRQIQTLKNRPAGQQLMLCMNLCDEAAKKGISVDFSRLSELLGIPVIPCMARQRRGLTALKEQLYASARTDGFDTSGVTSASVSTPETPIEPAILTAMTVSYQKPDYLRRQLAIDRILTGPFTGSIIMLLLLLGIFWLTITGANYPSALLWDLLFSLEERMAGWLTLLHAPDWLIQMLVYGVFRVIAWVVSVMLPPMAIFFPLFTLLEDLGYLPRAAFNMDPAFKKCKACGKQCLTMAMGLGCNAAGVTGCRIIDSPRERLIAILTNSLVPCNGRFPTLITLITLASMGMTNSLLTAAALTCFILLGIGATLAASYALSKTVLKGLPSSFTLELPPFRRPQFGKVLIRSVFDRTLFVLLRAVSVAAPAGLLIWLLANISPGGISFLTRLSSLLDVPGRLLGMDGMILTGFLLGFPANEIVLPIILMGYLQTGQLVEMTDSASLFSLFAAQGWTAKTAVCMAVFCLFHWPCSTTCLTIKKETGSLRWTAFAFLLPTAIGCLLCFLIELFF